MLHAGHFPEVLLILSILLFILLVIWLRIWIIRAVRAGRRAYKGMTDEVRPRR